MKMKRLSWMLGLLLLAGGAASLLLPTEAAADDVCLGPVQSTQVRIGFGDNCVEAEQDLYNKSIAQTSCEYGFCYEQLVIRSECRDMRGFYRISGHLDYKCAICF